VRSRYVTTNGIRLYCLESGPSDGPVVLLLHGFPELAYSWRHQVAALGDAGFRVIAPDLPGYGRSDKPDVTYDCEWIDATLIGLLDAAGCERAVIAGHDWGGILVWIMARRYPERIAGVIGVNTPDLPRSAMPPVQLLRQIFAETPIYIIQFQERGVAEWMLGTWGRGVDDFVEMIFGATTQNAEEFPPAVLDVYKDAFRPVGALTPPIEYYRNMDRNWDHRRSVPDDLGRERSRAHARDDGRHGGAHPRPRTRAHRRLRPLDPTGASPRDDRRDALVPAPPRALDLTRPRNPANSWW
jgi:epoxide hydrolase A/B